MWSSAPAYALLAIGLPASSVAPPDAALPRDRLPAELQGLDDAALGRIARMSPLPPLPPDPTNRVADDPTAAELGHRLFFDARVSPAGVSCATCHDPTRYFTDARPLARGIEEANRNTPTVIDAARRRWIGWDGKFDSIWSQALHPIENPREMGGSRSALVELVRSDPELRARYERVFGALPTKPAAEKPSGASSTESLDLAATNILKSLGAYQRKLLSGPTRVDRFVQSLRGEPAVESDALSASELRGLAIFAGRGGCWQCHRGPSFTDEEFHALGLAGVNGRVPDDPARLAAVEFLQANPMNSAGVHSDAPASPKAAMVRGLRRSGELFGQFRTPPLRGVALTAPYMHDGRFQSLAEVVRFYDTLEGAAPVGHHGELVLEPLGLGEEGRRDLAAFLEALTPEMDRSSVWLNPPGMVVRTEGVPTGR